MQCRLRPHISLVPTGPNLQQTHVAYIRTYLGCGNRPRQSDTQRNTHKPRQLFLLSTEFLFLFVASFCVLFLFTLTQANGAIKRLHILVLVSVVDLHSPDFPAPSSQLSDPTPPDVLAACTVPLPVSLCVSVSEFNTKPKKRKNSKYNKIIIVYRKIRSS